MYRKKAYIVGRIAGLLVVGIMACIFAVQTPKVQTKLTQKATESLKGMMDGTVSYDELSIMPSGAIMIKDLVIVDENPYSRDSVIASSQACDTIFSAKKITATFSLKGLLKSEGIHFGRVSVEDAYMYLTSEPGEYLSNLERVFRIKSSGKRPEPGPELFKIRRTKVDRFRFRYKNFLVDNPIAPQFGIDYNDIDLTATNGKCRNLRFAGGRMYGICDDISAVEKSGYKIQHLSGSCAAGQGKVLIEDIHMIDDWSDLKLKFYSMSFENAKSFLNFCEEVMLEGEFRKSKLAMKSIAYFAGAMQNNPSVLDIESGKVRGYTNDLAVKGLEFTDTYSGLSSKLECRLLGLPDIKLFSIDANLQYARFTSASISKFLTGFAGSTIDFSKILPGQRIFLSAKAKGPLNRLSVNGDIHSGSSKVKLTADIRNLIDTLRAIEIKGAINAEQVNLGSVLDTKELGEVSMYTELGAVLKKDLPDISIDSLRIDKVQAFGNKLRDISAKASFIGGTLKADISSHDSKADFDLSTLADIHTKEEFKRFKLNSSFRNLDLYALGIDQRSTMSKLKFIMDGDMVSNGAVIEGYARMGEILAENASGEKEIGEMYLHAYNDQGQQCFKFGAPFADIFLSGSHSIGSFISDVQQLTTRRELPAIYKNSSSVSGNGSYEIDIQLHDSRALLSYAVPGMYIADGTSLTLSIEEGGQLYGNLYSSLIAFESKLFREVNMQFDNISDAFHTLISGEEINVDGVGVDNPELYLIADNNKFSLSGIFSGFASTGGEGEIYIDGELYRDNDNELVLKAHPYDSYLSTADGVWQLSESNFVYHKKDLYVDGFKLSNGEQFIGVDGAVTKSRTDTLAINIDHLRLSTIDEFLSNKLGLDGTANGQAFLTSSEGKAMGLLMDVKVDSIQIGGVEAGKLQLSSILENSGEDMNIYLRNEIDGRNALYASGTYYLDDGHMDFRAELDKLPLDIISPFTKTIFNKLEGSLSGEMILQGLEGHMNPSSKNLHIEDAKIGLAYTGVEYNLGGPLRIEGNGIHFENISIADNSGGSAKLNAILKHDNFRDFALDGKLSLLNIKLLDARGDFSNDIYGLLRASGNANISGALDALSVNADIRTVGDGNVHISSGGSSLSTESNLLVFTELQEELDPYEQMLKEMNKTTRRSSDIDINARIGVQPGVKFYVELDKSSGNAASFGGNGNLDLHIRPSRDIFTVNGDFNINEGNYQFAIPGILSKDFDVQNGSSIKFAGDIMDTELDVDVIHSLQTTLTTILPNSTTSSGTRRLVECGITISDRLRDPKVDFTINIPDLDPTTKSQIETALNTEDKIQRQFIALLLMGSFIPDESSGVFNGSDVLFSNMSELMSGQINSILQKLDIPLDVGIGYQGAVSGTNMFDVAISTQLFNNRVIVGGSVHNRRFNNSVSTAEIVGDLDIQIKLDKQGQFRLNMFSHSADEYSSFLDLSQRSGVGISYQQEYNKFSEYLRSIFTSRKKKEQEALLPQEETEMVIINIDENEGKALPDSSAVGR